MAKSINITYALVGACHTTFTITDNLGNVVAQGVTGSELTQDFNVLVDDAATSITVHSENCSVTHNLDLPECLLAGIEVTKECSCYVDPVQSTPLVTDRGTGDLGDFGDYFVNITQLGKGITPIWIKCVSGYTFDGSYTQCADNRLALLWSPEACDDKRVEIILSKSKLDGAGGILPEKTSPSFFATSDELKAGWLVPKSIQWSDGSTGEWVRQPSFNWVVGSSYGYVSATFKTECGEYKIWTANGNLEGASTRTGIIY
jgi:hypothetical protein